MVSICFYGSVYILVYNIDIFIVKDICICISFFCEYLLFLMYYNVVIWILNNTRRRLEIMKRFLKLIS